MNKNTWPVRMPGDQNVIFLAGVGFIRIPKGVQFLKPSRTHINPRVRIYRRGVFSQDFTVTDQSGEGWQKAIYEAAKELNRIERLMGRRSLRLIESSAKKYPTGMAGVCEYRDRFIAYAESKSTYFGDKESAFNKRMNYEVSYFTRWQMRPEDVLKAW